MQVVVQVGLIEWQAAAAAAVKVWVVMGLGAAAAVVQVGLIGWQAAAAAAAVKVWVVMGLGAAAQVQVENRM